MLIFRILPNTKKKNQLDVHLFCPDFILISDIYIFIVESRNFKHNLPIEEIGKALVWVKDLCHD